MNDEEILELLATTDAFSGPDDRPPGAWSPEATRSAIERRTGVDTLNRTTHEPSAKQARIQQPDRRRALVFGVAFLIVLGIGAAIALLRSSGTPDVADTIPTGPNSAPATAVDPYFAARRDGDLAALADTLAGAFAYESFDTAGSADDLLHTVAWEAAEGTLTSEATCRSGSTSTVLVCDYTVHRYPARVVGALPVQVTSEFTFDETGRIATVRDTAAAPGFASIEDAFARFVEAVDAPAAQSTACCAFDNEEAARSLGALRAQYATQWGDAIARWGCNAETCDYGLLARALATIDAWFAAFGANDTAAVGALLQPGAPLASLDDELYSLMAFNSVAETHRTVTSCGPRAPLEPHALSILCIGTEEQYLHRAIAAGTVEVEHEFNFAPSALVNTMFFRYAPGALDEAVVPFNRWLVANGTGGLSRWDPLFWGESIAEATELAQLYATNADAWGAYLDENNCTYDEQCEP